LFATETITPLHGVLDGLFWRASGALNLQATFNYLAAGINLILLRFGVNYHRCGHAGNCAFIDQCKSGDNFAIAGDDVSGTYGYDLSFIAFHGAPLPCFRVLSSRLHRLQRNGGFGLIN
jgi:hypothetical protein